MDVLIVSFSFEQEPEAFDILRKAGLNPVLWPYCERKNADEQALITYWQSLHKKPVGLLIGADIPIGSAFLEQAKDLRAISLNCSGYDHVDLEAVRKHGVKLCHVPRSNYNAVADFIFGQIICLMRRIVEGDRLIRAGRWAEGVERSAAVSGKTIGIIGFGAIGQAVARRSRGFDMPLIVSSHSKNEELRAEFGAEFADGELFFGRADIVVLCCPDTPQTHHLINERTLSMMKRESVLINSSRGGLVDTKALIQALKEGTIAGAALDVYETEPLQQSELFQLQNTVLTPHMAGLADREIHQVAVQAAENMVKMIHGDDAGLAFIH